MATITINERTYDLLKVDKLTFSQQRTLKNLTGGMSLLQIMEGIRGGDADAVFGYLLLSVQSQNAKFTEDDLDACNMMDLLGQLRAAGEEEDGDVPPTHAAEAADSSDPSSGQPTPETDGTQSSPGGST